MLAVTSITPNELKKLLDAEKALVVDVRSMAEIERTGTIPGAICVPAIDIRRRARPGSKDFLSEFAESRAIVLYCAVGARSSAAAEILVDLGYRDVRNLGRFSDWVAEGLPVAAPNGLD